MAQVAFIVDEMFEDSEFRVPYDRIKQAGHTPVIIGVKSGKELKGKKGKETIKAEKSIDEVNSADFAALVIPGGYSPDQLRMNEKMVQFTEDFFNAGKPLAAICHAGSMLVEADIVDGKTVTSWPSIKTDLLNAGAQWMDQEVVEDGNLITSRKPDDLPAFCFALLQQLEKGSKARLSEEASPPIH